MISCKQEFCLKRFYLYRLTWLPVVEDEDEAPHVYGYLCDLIEANHAVVLGTNNAHLPRLISFFAEALFREAVPTDHPVMSRILSIVREIQVGKTFVYIYCYNSRIIHDFISRTTTRYSRQL